MPEYPDNRDIWLYRIEYTHESSPGPGERRAMDDAVHVPPARERAGVSR